MKEICDIQQMCRKFRTEDFSHRAPNTLFISIDIFQDILRNVKPKYIERSVENPNQWNIIGLNVLIIENKRNFMYVAIV